MSISIGRGKGVLISPDFIAYVERHEPAGSIVRLPSLGANLLTGRLRSTRVRRTANSPRRQVPREKVRLQILLPTRIGDGCVGVSTNALVTTDSLTANRAGQDVDLWIGMDSPTSDPELSRWSRHIARNGTEIYSLRLDSTNNQRGQRVELKPCVELESEAEEDESDALNLHDELFEEERTRRIHEDDYD